MKVADSEMGRIGEQGEARRGVREDCEEPSSQPPYMVNDVVGRLGHYYFQMDSPPWKL